MKSLSLLIKPVSGNCNLRCGYCFYADVAASRMVKNRGVMSFQTLETLVEKALSEAEEFCAIGFQGFLILVCVAIYAVLVQSIAISGDPIGAVWSCIGYTVLLCFTMFKTGSLAKSIFQAH